MNDQLVMVRGDSASWLLGAARNGAAYNLTGASLWFTAKYTTADADVAAVFQKTLADGLVITDAVNGLVTATLAPSDTSTLPDSRTILDWDLQVKTVAGSVYTVAIGKLTVFPDVTRTTT